MLDKNAYFPRSIVDELLWSCLDRYVASVPNSAGKETQEEASSDEYTDRNEWMCSTTIVKTSNFKHVNCYK